MATLKSIKNSYNQDGLDTNTENISLLSFKLATADSLSKFNLVDGFADDYQDATGVDTGTSTDEGRAGGNYYYGVGSTPVTATGGTITTDGSYTIHSFSQAQSGTNYVTDTTQSIDYLIVAGGGGGGFDLGAGGAAGGYRSFTSQSVANGTYAVTVGSGGTGSTSTSSRGGNGNNSSFNSSTSAGGGGGASRSSGPANSGGSGGGGAGVFSSSTAGGAGNTPSTSPAQGFAGGAAVANRYGGGGGGGAGGAGAAATTTGIPNPGGTGGAGGVGLSNSITGSAVFYAGGGGGCGGGGGPNAAGGNGGGGSKISGPGHGTDGLGGGGGGGASTGGTGGSGIVIIRRPTTADIEGGNMTLVSNAYTAQAAPTTTRIILDEYTSTGSATVNTDIKAYASRDGGTTYTQITLADQGTIETNHRLLSGSVDVSGQPSGTSIKYKIETFNQGVSKQTRVYGASMAWA
jgi:hypothetical protein